MAKKEGSPPSRLEIKLPQRRDPEMGAVLDEEGDEEGIETVAAFDVRARRDETNPEESSHLLRKSIRILPDRPWPSEPVRGQANGRIYAILFVHSEK